jgi:putative FmdB family regulatory protein
MPTYEYKCEKCGPFEMWQSMKDEPLGKCPKCGAKAERLVSAGSGFLLKGAGFYQNDYKKVLPPPPCASGPCEPGACDAKPSSGGHECSGGCCGT